MSGVPTGDAARSVRGSEGSMTTDCTACGSPVKDQAYLCQGCTDRLSRDLGDVGALAAELQTTRHKQDRMAGAATGVLSRSADKPLPWNQHAAEVDDALRATVVGWVRVVLEERGGRPPVDTMRALSGFLLASVEWIRHHADAAECADEIADAVARARQAVDRRQSRNYAGPCRADVEAHGDEGESCCVAELHGTVGARDVICAQCATRHDAAARRAWLLQIAEDQLATVAELAALLGDGDRPMSTNTIKAWVKRGRLMAHGEYTPALYRIGDAVDLVYGTRRESA